MIHRSFAPSFVPAPLPDQTLYSWVAMFHHLSGNVDETTTRKQLFGDGNTSIHFHLPANLDTFCRQTDGVLGTPRQVLETMTVVPFYTRLRNPEVAASVLKKVSGSSTGGMTRLLGIAGFLDQDYSPARHCVQCVAADHVKYGYARWRRTHQLPGVLVCVEHLVPLQTRNIDPRDRYSPRLLHPGDESGATVTEIDYCPNTRCILARLARLAGDLLSQPLSPHFSMERLRTACLLRSGELGIVDRETGHLDTFAAMAHYEQHFGEALEVLDRHPSTPGSGARALWDILARRGRRSNPHALLMLIDWLFGNWNGFLDAYISTKR